MALALSVVLESLRLVAFAVLAALVWRFASARGLSRDPAFATLAWGLGLLAAGQFVDLSDETTLLDATVVLGHGALADPLQQVLFSVGLLLVLFGLWRLLPLVDGLRERSRELAESQALHRALIEQSPDMIVIADAGDGRILDCNEAALAGLRLPRDRVGGRRLGEFFPEHQPGGRPSTELARALAESLRSTPQTELRWTWRRDDGSTVEIQGTTSVVELDGRRLLQLRGRPAGAPASGVEAALREVASAVSLSTGDAFFLELARAVARIFDVPHVVVGRFDDEGEPCIETLAHVAPDAEHRSARHPVAGTPFERVRQGESRVVSGNLQALYPSTEWYRDNGIRSCLAVPARDSAGNTVGMVAILAGAPVREPIQIEYVLQIFASRVAAEIERREALAALRRGTSDLRTALAGADAALWRWEPARALLVLTRHDAADGEVNQTRGRLADWLSQRSAAERGAIEKRLRDSVDNGTPLRFEYSHALDGAFRWFEAAGTPQIDTGGRTRAVVGIVRDITERHALLEALRTSESRLLRAMAESGVGVWEWEFASDALKVIASDDSPLYGVARTLPTMASFLARRDPDERREFAASHARMLAGEGDLAFDFRVPGADGGAAWFHASGTLERDARGSPCLVRGLVRETTRERESRAALELSATRLGIAVSATGARVWEWDRATDRVSLVGVAVDRPAAALDVPLDDWLAVQTPEAATEIRAALLQCVESGAPFQVEYPRRLPEGGTEWAESRGVVRRDGSGAATGIVGVSRSIDESRRLEEALAALARTSIGQDFGVFLRDIVQSLVALFRVDVVALERYEPGPPARMRVIGEWERGDFVEEYAYPIAGTPEEIVIRERRWLQSDDVRLEYPLDPWQQQRGLKGYLSLPLCAGSGAVLGVISLMHTEPLRLTTGRRRLLEVFAERLAIELDRHEHAQALAEQRDKLEELVAARTALLREQAVVLDTLQEGVVVRDEGGYIAWANAGAERMLGYGPGQLTGRQVTRILTPEVIERRTSEILEPLFRDGYVRTEIPLRRSDGSDIDCLVTGTALRDEAGQVRRIVYLAVDISERKRAESELRRSRSELAELNTELEAFSYSVSHDLRAPLRSIDGFSEILEEDFAAALGADGLAHLARIRTAARRMSQLIDDMLDLARVSRREVERSPLDLAQIAREAVDRLREREPERAVEIVVAPEMPCEGDRGLLAIVMDNLVGNAWKYTGRRAAPRIEIGVERDGEETVFFVADNGAGFDMRYAERLFGVFQRLHPQGEFEGTGVGLATVKRIVTRHGGRIWAEAAEGQGACFRFTLRARGA